MTEAQILLRTHLLELGIETVPEYKFLPDRKFAFDLASLEHRIGFECNGHWQGKHGASWSQGFEKLNLAQMNGWRVLVFHNRDVLNGKARAFVEDWLNQAQPDNGPTCHKCGKLVETGDILCSEHEQQMVQALISAAKSKED